MTRYILLFLTVILVSCAKKQEIKISAVNPVTGNPIPGLKYEILSERTGWDGEVYKTVASGRLNENGVALVDLRLKKNRSYLLNIETPPNTCYDEPKDITFDRHNQEFDFKFKLAPCAFINMQVNNVNCQGENDVMNYRERFSYSDWSGWSHDINGCFSNLSSVYVAAPSGLRIFNWKVSRNGITTEYLDSIYLNEGEYGSILLEY